MFIIGCQPSNICLHVETWSNDCIPYVPSQDRCLRVKAFPSKSRFPYSRQGKKIPNAIRPNLAKQSCRCSHFLSFRAFFLMALSFLFTFSFLSCLLAAPVAFVGLSDFSSTSTIHWLSAALFAPLYPHLRSHSPVASLYCRFCRAAAVLGLMPFLAANRCHLV